MSRAYTCVLKQGKLTCGIVLSDAVVENHSAASKASRRLLTMPPVFHYNGPYDEVRTLMAQPHFCDNLRSQMSSVAAKSLARKMRLNLPENPKLVLHTFTNPKESGQQQTDQAYVSTQTSNVPSSNKPAEGSAQAPPTQYPRRYSNAQEERDQFDSNAILSRFNRTICDSSRLGYQANRSHNIYNSMAVGGESDLQQRRSDLVRHSSTPNFFQKPANNVGVSAEAPPGDGTHRNPITTYFRRRRSSDALGLSMQQRLQLQDPNASADADKTGAASANQVVLATQSGQLQSKQSPVVAGTTGSGMDQVDSNLSSSPPKQQHGFILSQTRRFGAWLSKATEGEKVEVTSKDINAIAPNSF